MNVYQYIAEANPEGAYEICKKYGFFQIADSQEMGDCLERIVAQEGEGALTEVMALHPDKEVLFELFDKKKEEPKKLVGEVGDAERRIMRRMSMNARNNMMNANGAQNLPNQTNTYILVAALIVSVAIISMKKQ